MGQRLGMAAALLGEPRTLILDEPSNGLDPEGIRWIRSLLQEQARAGCTVFVSSHLMSEMSVMADKVIVIGRGRLIADTTVDEFVQRASGDVVRVRTPQAGHLTEVLVIAGGSVAPGEDGALRVTGLRCEAIGDAAATAGIPLHELTPEQATLEEAFMRLTRDAVEFHAHGAAGDERETVGAAS
jgi:ABC-2 type transport system ATP-binding protein